MNIQTVIYMCIYLNMYIDMYILRRSMQTIWLASLELGLNHFKIVFEVKNRFKHG